MGFVPSSSNEAFHEASELKKTSNVLLGAWVILTQNQVPQNYVLNAGLEISDLFFLECCTYHDHIPFIFRNAYQYSSFLTVCQ